LLTSGNGSLFSSKTVQGWDSENKWANLSCSVQLLSLLLSLHFFPHVGNDGLANMVMETPEYIPVVCYEVLVFDDVQFISQKACIQIYTVIPICYSFVSKGVGMFL
jgi:hypothetical protein